MLHKMSMLFEFPRRTCSCLNLSSKAATFSVAIGNVVIAIALGIYSGLALSYLEPVYRAISTFLDFRFDINGLGAVHAFLFFFAVIHALINFMLIFAAKLESKLLCNLWLAVTVVECTLSITFFTLTSVLVHAIFGIFWILIGLKNVYVIFVVLTFIQDLENYRRTQVAIPGIGKIDEVTKTFRTTDTNVLNSDKKDHLKQAESKHTAYQPTRIFRLEPVNHPTQFRHDDNYNPVRWVTVEIGL